MKNKILYIIPIDNDEQTIQKSLDVFRDPSVGDILIVDDGSTDDTWELVKENKNQVAFLPWSAINAFMLEDFQFEVIKEVGCKGDYTMNPHTFDNFRKEFYISNLITRGNVESDQINKIIKERIDERLKG